MTTRWMHPPELERPRPRDRFDPVVEGGRHGLSRALSLAIWERVCADATDRTGRRDTEQAERRFHEIAARIAARGGRLWPDVGRLTRVGTEITGVPVSAWGADELAPRTPGRETLVAVEARRRAVQDPVASTPVDADAATAGSALPGADEVMRAMTALQPPVRPEPARPLPATVQSHARPPRDLRGWAPPTRPPVAPAASLAAQIGRTFGAAAGDVAITPDSTRPLAAGAEGVAVGEQVYIAPGYYDLTTTAGRERLGHEVAHVLQQRRGRDLPARLGAGERAGLEAEADRAGHAFARGQPFAVQGRAPAPVALFKGPAPANTPAATTTTIDLKSGGKIERKPPPAGSDPAAAPPAGGKDPPKAQEQLIVTFGALQASNPFTIERDDSGEAVRLVGKAAIALPASKYIKPLELTISLGSDGYLGAKIEGSAVTTIKLGGLEVRGGTLTAGIDHGQLSYALDGATIALPKDIGDGALSIQGNGDQEPAFDASLAINVPKMQPATMSFHADASGYQASGSTGVDIKMASGSVTFSLEKVGDDRALWSAAGTVGYNSERLSGQISVQYNADGELSGEGTLDFQIADFLTGQATVAVDKDGHVTVNGEIRPPDETQLFPEKKIEQTFFHKSVDFPIWGISIPMVGSVGIIAFIEGSMGYRVGVGAGVMRNIVLSGQYSTDPSVQPTFGITGEIFIPAFAELLISIGGGVKLDAFIADVGGGLKVDGRAGFYGGLSVRPTLAYEGGKYKLTGQAILAGDVGLQATLDAFVKLHVGKWMFSWEKEWDWKLGEWDKFLGLNLGMEADLDYTLGQPLSPDIFKLKKPDSLDVQNIAQSAMPKDGMPPQGPKGAQNQHTEFDPKSDATPTSASSPDQQPNVAGTPPGAAGHKNQDPKGTTVKPAPPPKPGKAKPAPGKNASQTGPNPKNNSKPTEPKLDATPITEPFTMHGESHQLIVQLGSGGHVDMASKRERLSVKVGHAVGKLIAKHASPEQIADLKEIGDLAKKGDKMAATAKTHDKEGTTKAAHQIAAYGARWEVKDLDEVAIKAPHAITVTHPVHLEKLSDALNKALGSAHSGQVIASKPGDPKEVTRQLLEKHPDAHFDFPSARLTLPALHPAPLAAAHGADPLGELLAQQTGVTKVSLKQSAQKGELKLELIGAIGEVTATLGTAVVDAVPHSLAVPHPVHLDKLSEPLAKALSAAHGGEVIFHKSGDPRQLTHQLLQQHADAHFDFPTAKLTLPAPHPAPLQAAHGVDPLGQLLAQQTGVSKITLQRTDQKDELKFELTGAIGEATATLGTAVVDPLPHSLAVPNPVHLDKPSEELAKALGAAHSGQVIFNSSSDPRQVTRQLLQQHSDAHFDFPTGKLTLPAPHPAPLQAAHGIDQLGQLLAQQTGVLKITTKQSEHDGQTKLEFIGEIGATATLGTAAAAAAQEIPKTLTIPGHAKLDKQPPSLAKEIAKAASGTEIWVAPVTDPKQVTANLLHAHADAHFDPATKNLQLPSVHAAALSAATSLAQLGHIAGQQLGVSKITVMKTEPDHFTLVGSINPSVTFADGQTVTVNSITIESFAFDPKDYNPSLIKAIKVHTGGTIYTSPETDDVLLEKAIKHDENALREGTLHLPRVTASDVLKRVQSVGGTGAGMGAEIGRQTYARQVTFSKDKDTFTVQVGFKDKELGPVIAVTGLVLMTPEERIQLFSDRWTLERLEGGKEDQYKPGKDCDQATKITQASKTFQNHNYVSFFDGNTRAMISPEIATADLKTWQEQVNPCGKLSRVGSSSSLTYIRVDPYVPVVIDLKSKDADENLKAAVDAAGIVPFMKAVAKSKKDSTKAPGGIDYNTFLELWESPANVQFLSGRFRDAYEKQESVESQGAHEWIPCTEMPETIARAADPDHWLEGERWIDLHHQMRTSTAALIGAPGDFWLEVVDATTGDKKWRPQGHSGAVYLEGSDKKRTEQSVKFGSVGEFHNALRSAVKGSESIKGWAAKMLPILKEYIWNGTGHKGKDLDPDIMIRGRSGREIDLEELAGEQKTLYDQIYNMFDGLLKQQANNQ